MHCMPSYSSVCSVPNNPLVGCFLSHVSVAEQEVDGSGRNHLSSPQPCRYKPLSLNEGSVADVKLLQSISLQGGPCRHQIIICTSTDCRIGFSRQDRIRTDKKAELPFKPCFSAVGRVSCRLRSPVL